MPWGQRPVNKTTTSRRITLHLKPQGKPLLTFRANSSVNESKFTWFRKRNNRWKINWHDNWHPRSAHGHGLETKAKNITASRFPNKIRFNTYSYKDSALYLCVVPGCVLRRHQLAYQSFKLLLFGRHVAHHIAQSQLVRMRRGRPFLAPKAKF